MHVCMQFDENKFIPFMQCDENKIIACTSACTVIWMAICAAALHSLVWSIKRTFYTTISVYASLSMTKRDHFSQNKFCLGIFVFIFLGTANFTFTFSELNLTSDCVVFLFFPNSLTHMHVCNSVALGGPVWGEEIISIEISQYKRWKGLCTKSTCSHWLASLFHLFGWIEYSNQSLHVHLCLYRRQQ